LESEGEDAQAGCRHLGVYAQGFGFLLIRKALAVS
jgi:hypothetical protein